MSDFTLNIQDATEKAKKNKIISGSLFAVSLILYVLSIVWVAKDNTGSAMPLVCMVLMSPIFIIMLVLFIMIMVDCKVKTWTYKHHRISAYNGVSHHVTYVDGRITEVYGTIWWQHTSSTKVDDDEICVRFGPIGVYFFVREGVYARKDEDNSPTKELERLKKLLDSGAISYGEYETAKEKILKKM